MRPAIILVDEPTSELDPELVNEVLDVMRILASEGMPMICLTTSSPLPAGSPVGCCS